MLLCVDLTPNIRFLGLFATDLLPFVLGQVLSAVIVVQNLMAMLLYTYQ